MKLMLSTAAAKVNKKYTRKEIKSNDTELICLCLCQKKKKRGEYQEEDEKVTG